MISGQIRCGSAGGGGGYKTWTAGAYTAGQMVKRGNFLFGCEAPTSVDPCVDFGDVTNASLWNYNNCFSHNTALGWCQLIASALGTSANMISKTSTTENFLKRRFVIDVSISGSADALGFGFYDASLTQTPSGSMGSFVGNWGVELDMYNSRVLSYANGVVGSGPVSVNNLVNDQRAGNFKRWFLDVIDIGGGLMTFNVYHQPSAGRIGSSGSGTMLAITDDMQFVAQFPSITIPTLSSGWRFIATARTGGAAGDFRVKLAQAVYTGTEWSYVGQVPMYNVQKA